MTFSTPATSSVFLSLSDKLKYAITHGETARFLISSAPCWNLRNDVGFHAALAQMVDALLERAVLPYQTTSSLSSLTVLPSAEINGSSASGSKLVAAAQLPTAIATASKRSQLGTETRFAPLEFWMAILKGTYDISNLESKTNLMSGEVELFPPVYYAFGAATASSFSDISGTGWTREPWRVIYEQHTTQLQVSDLLKPNGAFKDADNDTESMLYALIWDFNGYDPSDPPHAGNVFVESAVQLVWYDPYMDTICKHFNSGLDDPEKIQGLWNWTPMAATYTPGLNYRTRPNLDLLHVYQVLLGCHWAQWARMQLTVRIPHRVTSVIYEYTIHPNGDLSLESRTTEVRYETFSNLHYEQGIYFEDSSWSFGESRDATVTFEVTASDFDVPSEDSDESGGDEPIDVTSRIIELARAAIEHGGTVVIDGIPPTPPEYSNSISMTVVSYVINPDPSYGNGISVQFTLAYLSTPPWPAESVVNGGYVAAESVAFAACAQDTIYAPDTTSSYTPQRTPTDYIYHNLIIESTSSSVSTSTPGELIAGVIEDIVGDPTTGLTSALGGQYLPYSPLPVYPSGSGSSYYAHIESGEASTPEEATYFDTTDTFNEQPGQFFLITSPHLQIVDANGAVLWDEDIGGTIEVDFDRAYSAHSQSGSAPVPGEIDSLDVGFSAHCAVRAVWNWKSMPVSVP